MKNELSRRSSSSYSTLSELSEDEDGKAHPAHVRMILLSSDPATVLMDCKDGKWDLPCFVYPKSINHGDRIDRCCRDLKHWLGVRTKKLCFTGTTELIGDLGITFESRDVSIKLIVMESHLDADVEDMELPQGAAWKDLNFVSSLVNTVGESAEDHLRLVMEVLLNFMSPQSSIRAALTDPRYKFGWCARAASHLLSVVEQDDAEAIGRVFQHNMSYSSTLLYVSTSRGKYFLKSPALGCNECSITATISSIFPNNSPEVLSTDVDLNCFVTRGFVHDVYEQDIREVALTLGRIQLESLNHVDRVESCRVSCPGPQGASCSDPQMDSC